jgi:hypothetical protein
MNIIKQNNYDFNDLWKEIYACCVGTQGGRNVWVKKSGIFNFSFLFLGIFRDERFIFVKTSFF